MTHGFKRLGLFSLETRMQQRETVKGLYCAACNKRDVYIERSERATDGTALMSRSSMSGFSWRLSSVSLSSRV